MRQSCDYSLPWGLTQKPFGHGWASTASNESRQYSRTRVSVHPWSCRGADRLFGLASGRALAEAFMTPHGVRPRAKRRCTRRPWPDQILRGSLCAKTLGQFPVYGATRIWWIPRLPMHQGKNLHNHTSPHFGNEHTRPCGAVLAIDLSASTRRFDWRFIHHGRSIPRAAAEGAAAVILGACSTLGCFWR